MNNNFLTDPLLTRRIAQSAQGDEDAAQAVALKLLEVARATPRFARQSSHYHVKRAAWEARHYREKSHIYDRYVACEPHALDPEDGEPVSAFDEYLPADTLTPEDALIERDTLDSIHAAIDALPAAQRKVARLLAAGFDPSDIARKLGMSRSSVSHAIARARAALASALEA